MKNLVVISVRPWIRRSLRKRRRKIYSKEDSDNESKDAKILFMGIDTQTHNGESYEESEVELEA